MNENMITPDDSFNRVHTYFKGSPYHPDGDRILYTKFRSLEDTGYVCLLSTSTNEERVLGETHFFTYHSGACAYLCDGGRKVIYQQQEELIALCDIETGSTSHFAGSICNYSGNLADKFIQIDRDFPLERQREMGIYIRNIDGSDTSLLADVDRLLERNPRGANIRSSGVLLRLGAEISPDQQKVILFLVTRNGTLVRDYYTCSVDGSQLEFHGELGTHIMWHPNSRDIYSYAKPWHTVMGSLREYISDPSVCGFLARYNTQSHVMELASEHGITSGECHVSPSPDGRRVVLDEFNEKTLSIMIFDEHTGEMMSISRQCFGKTADEAKTTIRPKKHYEINPHPVFSRDGTRIVFNSRTGGSAQLCEVRL